MKKSGAKEEMLPRGVYLNLIEWTREEFDINTGLFDDITEDEFTGTLEYLLPEPVVFKVKVEYLEDVWKIIEAIKEIYGKDGFEDFCITDLIITSLIVDFENNTITTKFLGE